MPKAEKLSTKRSAVLARERREREKNNNEYAEALKEFLHFKYSHIVAEFNPLYEMLKNNRPESIKYTNTNEFRLWRKREIGRLVGEQRQDEQQQQQPQAEQPQDEQPQDEQPQDEQPQDEQSQDEQSQDEQSQDEQSQDEQSAFEEEQQQQNEQPVFEEQQLVNELANLVDEVVADHDEGIALDLWEELQDDIEQFDYQLEVELDQYMQ